MSAEHSAIYAIVWQALRESGAASSWDVEFSGWKENETLTIRKKVPVPSERRTVQVPQLQSVPLQSGLWSTEQVVTPSGAEYQLGKLNSVAIKPGAWFERKATAEAGAWCDNCGATEEVSWLPGGNKQAIGRNLCSGCLSAGCWPTASKVKRIADRVREKRAEATRAVPELVG